MADPRIRQIKIKTGVVKRLAKEEVLYIKEAKQQEEKIERLKAEAGDEYFNQETGKKNKLPETTALLRNLRLTHKIIEP
ncbi:tubulin-specific chaperone A-like [Carassius auratus]|uniref:Tubulin-specific chaperone A n=1 Tax=Carassius auratus TaxID=7957 RepID=A0A6P6N2P4_CARAU|nr:tubulin-specific chaperone A-like [Carassius auratus]